MRPLAVLCPLLLGIALPALAADTATLATPPSISAAPAEASADNGTPDLPAGTIYLMTRIQLNGTDFGQVSFLQDRGITTLDVCDKEREAGMTVGWNAYHPYLRTYRGMSYRVEYRCVVSEQKLSAFRYNEPLDNFYLVRTSSDNRLHIERHRNFFACRDHLEAQGQHQSIDAFCAKAGQRVMDK